DCDIFAVVIDTECLRKIFFNCQVFKGLHAKPKIKIHGIQGKSCRSLKLELKIKIMIVGYDKEFNFVNLDNSDTSVQIRKYVGNPQDPCKFSSIPLQDKLESPFFGIPVLSKLDTSNNHVIIGHNFRNTQSQLDTNHA